MSNVGLILAVGGADTSPSGVRLAGFASLLAGALSMAAGERVSVRNQVELYAGLLDELAGHLEDAGFGGPRPSWRARSCPSTRTASSTSAPAPPSASTPRSSGRR